MLSGPHTPPPSTPSDSPKEDPSWVWWPSWYALRTHYFHQIGFWACFFQFLGATIFWISGFTVLPHVINMNNVVLANCAFWLPQVIGGTGFIISRYTSFFYSHLFNHPTPRFSSNDIPVIKEAC